MNVLIVQTAFLGDIILSTPVIDAVQREHPNASISFLTTPLGHTLLNKTSSLKEVLVFDKRGVHGGIKGLFQCARQLRARQYDIAYSLHKSWRTALLLWLARIPVRVGFKSAKLSWLYTTLRHRPPFLHDVHRNLSIVGTRINTDKDSLKLQLSSDPLHGVELKNPYIVIAPGSVWTTKRWHERRFKQLVKNLSEYEPNTHVVLVGSPEEQALCCEIAKGTNALNVAGSLGLEDTAKVIAGANAVVCNDSAPLHMASAFQIPVVVLYCATGPEFGFGPWKTPHRILQSETLSCKPCSAHGSHRCPTGTHRCRTDVQASQVIDALKELGCLS